MSDPLPVFIQQRLEELLRAAQLAHGELAAGAQTMSQKYRRLDGGGTPQNLQMSGVAEAYAYAATRMPATYAAVTRVLRMMAAMRPEFNPQTSFDIGAGPGTATLALRNFYESISYSELLEPNKYLRQVGQNFLNDDALWIAQDLQSHKPSSQHDVVIASYVFNELPTDNIEAAVLAYWATCRDSFIVIEPGTPHGAEIIARIRRILISVAGANLMGPCPHSGECPLAQDKSRWCHVSVRVERSRLHRQLKGGELGYEDEKFSWIAFTRSPVSRPDNRLIGYPTGTKLRELQVCDASGQASSKLIPKSHALFKVIRKLDWGDGYNDA